MHAYSQNVRDYRKQLYKDLFLNLLFELYFAFTLSNHCSASARFYIVLTRFVSWLLKITKKLFYIGRVSVVKNVC
jgi:hypothetical protein